MARDTYIYVDGENHFHLSKDSAAAVFGHQDAIEAIAAAEIPPFGSFPHASDTVTTRFHLDKDSLFFWDNGVMSQFYKRIQRAVYVTSCIGRQKTEDGQQTTPEQQRNAVSRTLRAHGFESIVVIEEKRENTRRRKIRENVQLLEKPKGCDIALSTRMVADAAMNLYEECCLFTSDADFLPAVQAVRAMGKRVHVFGYTNGLRDGIDSPFHYLPDSFTDLEHASLNAITRAPHHRKLVDEIVEGWKQHEPETIELKAVVDGRDDLNLQGVLERYAKKSVSHDAAVVLAEFRQAVSDTLPRLGLEVSDQDGRDD